MTRYRTERARAAPPVEHFPRWAILDLEKKKVIALYWNKEDAQEIVDILNRDSDRSKASL